MTNLIAVLQRAREVGLFKLNKDEPRLCQTDVKYMGNIPPMPFVLIWTSDSHYRYEKNVQAVQSFVGLATYLSRFSLIHQRHVNLSWQLQQEEAFQSVTSLVSRQRTNRKGVSCHRVCLWYYVDRPYYRASEQKPLEITSKKSVLKPLQRMLLRLQNYNLVIVYTRGKKSCTMEILCRALIQSVIDSTLLHLLRN